MKTLRIAVGRDESGWHDKFVDSLQCASDSELLVSATTVNMEADDWWQRLERVDALVWKPAYMGPIAASHLKEKVYFIESHLKKRVIPNFHTVWTFESKIAQSYIMRHSGVRTPTTIASGDYHDAMALVAKQKFPLVSKESAGAGSTNVTLLKNLVEAKRRLDSVFCHQLWAEAKTKHKSTSAAIRKNLSQRWFWQKLVRTFTETERFKYSYLQEYVPNNPSDLRITVIGDMYAFGFWRKNRPNDFRASGSGLIDYTTPVPVNIVEYCLSLSRRFHFDSMAYDILLRDDSFAVIEMSYGYLDSAIYGSDGYYVMVDNRLEFVATKTWPQELWIRWLIKTICEHAGAVSDECINMGETTA